MNKKNKLYQSASIGNRHKQQWPPLKKILPTNSFYSTHTSKFRPKPQNLPVFATLSHPLTTTTKNLEESNRKNQHSHTLTPPHSYTGRKIFSFASQPKPNADCVLQRQVPSSQIVRSIVRFRTHFNSRILFDRARCVCFWCRSPSSAVGKVNFPAAKKSLSCWQKREKNRRWKNSSLWPKNNLTHKNTDLFPLTHSQISEGCVRSLFLFRAQVHTSHCVWVRHRAHIVLSYSRRFSFPSRNWRQAASFSIKPPLYKQTHILTWPRRVERVVKGGNVWWWM